MADAPPPNTPNQLGLILPAYILLRPDGVFVNLSPPPAREALQMFVDRLFASETRFAGLNYVNFLNLLYGDEPLKPVGDKTEVRLADNIVAFPPERMALYKSVKVLKNGELAEYMFEPASIEKVTETPVYGEPGEDGTRPVIDHTRTVEREPVKFDFDEFVASMWIKGVRFGINEGAVHEAIAKGEAKRMTIATMQAPTESKDAEVAEESKLLHQDNAPLILPNGMADLRRARNRFPQVGKDTVLLRKIPRMLGKAGYHVTGARIEPRAPEDIDMNRLAGQGTRVEQNKKGEFLIASIDGFVDLDDSTGAICVLTKIEDKGGISLKASGGDIKLDVDDFTEHGEVQEGRVVEGKHMSFRSDVFGTVIAKDGHIELGHNISGGRAKSIGGNVIIKGKCIHSVVEAWDGMIKVEFAEESLIMGKSVVVGRAVNCEIIAEELQVNMAEGSALAGKKLQVKASNSHKDRETVISILLPDIDAYNREIAEAKHELEQLEAAIKARNREIAAHQTDPGFARYLAMNEQVKAGHIKFNEEQIIGWHKIVNHFAPLMRGTEALAKKCEVLEGAIAQLTHARENCGAGEYCTIENILGDTVARKIGSNLGMPYFREQPEDELRPSLHQIGLPQERIFSGSQGNLDWHFKPPEPESGSNT